MGLTAHLVAKDLKRKLRSPLGLIAALAFPVLFSGLIAIAFGRSGGIPKVHMLIVNEDDGIASSLVASAFTSQQASDYFDSRTVERGEGLKLINAGKASAMLTIPKGFTKDLLDGRATTLSLLRNPSEGILPEIAEQTAGAISDILDAARRVLDRPVSELRPLLSEGAANPSDADIVAISIAVKRAIEGVGGVVNPPAIDLEGGLFATAKDTKPQPKGDTPSVIFLAVLPGVAVYGLFLVADQGMRDVMTERTLGTLRRQLAGPVTGASVIWAKAAFTALLSGIALAIMTAIGGAVLTTHVSLPAFLLVSAALVLAVTGTCAAIYGLARTERQAATLGNMIFLLMGFLGGGFLQVDSLPAVLQVVAPATPLYWATKAYRELLENGTGVPAIARSVVVLAVMGVVLLSIGASSLSRMARRSGT